MALTYELIAAPNGMQLKIDADNYVNIPCGSCSVSKYKNNLIIAFVNGSGKWTIPYSQVTTPAVASLDLLVDAVSTLLACAGGGGGGGGGGDASIAKQNEQIVLLENIEALLDTAATGANTIQVGAIVANVAFTIKAADSTRLGLTLWNDTGNVLYVSLGATVSTSSYTVILNDQGYYELPFKYVGIITGLITAAATGDVHVTQLT